MEHVGLNLLFRATLHESDDVLVVAGSLILSRRRRRRGYAESTFDARVGIRRVERVELRIDALEFHRLRFRRFAQSLQHRLHIFIVDGGISDEIEELANRRHGDVAFGEELNHVEQIFA